MGLALRHEVARPRLLGDVIVRGAELHTSTRLARCRRCRSQHQPAARAAKIDESIVRREAQDPQQCDARLQWQLAVAGAQFLLPEVQIELGCARSIELDVLGLRAVRRAHLRSWGQGVRPRGWLEGDGFHC